MNTFLGQLLAASHPHALAEKQEVEEFARRQGFKGELQRWDWAYYSNKLKQEKYALDDEMLKTLFQTGKCTAGGIRISQPNCMALLLKKWTISPNTMKM